MKSMKKLFNFLYATTVIFTVVGGGGKCLTLQLRFGGENRILFTGAQFLIKQIEKVDKSLLPVATCIVKQEDGSYLFE